MVVYFYSFYGLTNRYRIYTHYLSSSYKGLFCFVLLLYMGRPVLFQCLRFVLVQNTQLFILNVLFLLIFFLLFFIFLLFFSLHADYRRISFVLSTKHGSYFDLSPYNLSLLPLIRKTYPRSSL